MFSRRRWLAVSDRAKALSNRLLSGKANDIILRTLTVGRMKTPTRLRAVLVALILAAPLVLSTPTKVSAYVLEGGCKWPDTIYYQNSTSGKYSSPSVYATNDWTATPTRIFLRQYTSPPPYVDIRAINYGNTSFDGTTSYNCDYITHAMQPTAYSDYNTYYTSSASYTFNALQSLMVHELGHAIGLAHAGSSSCSGQPIMYYLNSRYFTCNHIVPQQDDINGINALYTT